MYPDKWGHARQPSSSPGTNDVDSVFLLWPLLYQEGQTPTMSAKVWSDFTKAFPESPEASGDALPIVNFACCCDDRKRRGQLFLTQKRLYFHSQMLGVLRVCSCCALFTSLRTHIRQVQEELAAVATVVADEKDKINKAIVVTLDREEPCQWRFLSFREDVKTVISTILEKSAAARQISSGDKLPDASEVAEQVETVADEAPAPAAAEPKEQESTVEKPEVAVPAPAATTSSSPKLRKRPPGMVVPKAEATAAPKAASVIDSIRQRQQKEKLERQQYAERLRQKAESQSKAVSDATEPARTNGAPSAGQPTGLDGLLGLLPLAKRFAALFGLIFISSCIVMPNSIRAETYTDIFAAALFLAALDVAANPVALAAALAALTKPHLAQHKAMVCFPLLPHTLAPSRKHTPAACLTRGSLV